MSRWGWQEGSRGKGRERGEGKSGRERERGERREEEEEMSPGVE